MFQGLRPNATIYILDKPNKSLKEASVTFVSNPQPKYGFNTPNQFTQQNFEMEVEVRAKAGDEEIIIKELPANLSVRERNGIVVSDNREAMCAEIEAIKKISENIIESVEYHKDAVSAYNSMLESMNPQLAKEKEQEKKISNLEARISNIDKNMEQMMSMMSKALENGSSKSK